MKQQEVKQLLEFGCTTIHACAQFYNGRACTALGIELFLLDWLPATLVIARIFFAIFVLHYIVSRIFEFLIISNYGRYHTKQPTPAEVGLFSSVKHT